MARPSHGGGGTESVEGSVRIFGHLPSNDPRHEYLRRARRAEPLGQAPACCHAARFAAQTGTGRIDWIEDKHVYDAGVPGRPAPWQETDPVYWVPKEVKRADRRTPLIGRIRSGGKVEPDEDWQEEWGRHIPQRYGKGHDIYGLELDQTGQSVVLRYIPVWEFQEGMAAVYCWNGWEAEGWFGRVYLQATEARVVTPNGEKHDLDLATVVRIGKLVGRWPLSDSRLQDCTHVGQE